MSVNDIKIMLIGETGAGKSQLGNFLLQKEKFKVGHNNNSETETISECSSNIGNMRVTIIDTPGLNDTLGRDEENMNLIVEKFQNDSSIDGMILVYSYRNSKKVQKHQELLNNLITIFGKDLLKKRLKVIITNCTVGEERDISEERKEETQKKDIKKFLLDMVKEDDMIFVNSKMTFYKYFQKNIEDLFKNFLEIKRNHGSIKKELIKKKELEFIEKQKKEAERKQKELEKQMEEEERKRKELEKQMEEEERKRKELEKQMKEEEKNNIQISYRDIADKISEYKTKISDAKQRILELKANKKGQIAGTVASSILLPFTLGFSAFAVAGTTITRNKINSLISQLENDISYYNGELNKLEEIEDNILRKLKNNNY